MIGVARRVSFCSPHPLNGKRPELTLEQLDDLARSAIDAGDRVAFNVITVAMAPARLCWQSIDFDRHAMAHAIDAWVGRCRRTGGRPWMRSFGDPSAERPCPGCEACINPHCGVIGCPGGPLHAHDPADWSSTATATNTTA